MHSWLLSPGIASKLNIALVVGFGAHRHIASWSTPFCREDFDPAVTFLSPHPPSPSLHFVTSSLMQQSPGPPYFSHPAIRYTPHHAPQDTIKDFVSLVCTEAVAQPNGAGGVAAPGMSKVPTGSFLAPGMLPPPPPPPMPRPVPLSAADTKPPLTASEGGGGSPTSPTHTDPGTPPSSRPFVSLGPARDPSYLHPQQTQASYMARIRYF
uniref:Uncharacterized protein n=1 Tax=Eptatretus burgeri TaxID=7764 RepID=A0A8C4QYK4_EPTBU